MSEWTDKAKTYLDQALLGLVGKTHGGGLVDAEYVEDIRIHVETEVAEKSPTLVTEDMVRGIMLRVVGFDPLIGSRDERVVTKQNDALRKRVEDPFLGNSWIKFVGWTFAVILPVVTLLIELFYGMCSSGFFDPIPTRLHILLVALVPGISVWNLLAISKKRKVGHWNFRLIGVAVLISLYYAIPFAVMIPFAVIGIIFFGIGLLPLAPVLCLVLNLGFVRSLRRLYPEVGKPWKHVGIGVLFGLALLVAIESPRYLTTYGMTLAESSNPEKSLSGIQLLRTFGSDEVMLNSCLPEFRNQSGALWIAPRTSPQKAREIYFRVTGHEYYLDANQRAAEISDKQLFNVRSRWDWYRGDQLVGRPLEGLSVQHSRIDGVVDANAGNAYLEWTMEFVNEEQWQQEARALWKLPPGATVTRVNLWVNGEVREAAFSAKSKVVQAYRNVVRQRRDPILVTTKGADHILAQCFPVPPAGGKMKIRIGMIIPVDLSALDEGRFVFPSLAAQNFEVRDELRIPVWLESKTPISSTSLGSPDLNKTIQTNIRFSEVQDGPIVVHSKRNPEIKQFWSENPYSDGIVQGSIVSSEEANGNWIVVVDSSAGLRDWASSIVQTLAKHKSSISKVLIVDEAEGYSEVQDLNSLSIKPSGGIDNAPALEAAFRFAGALEDASILWIHGTQSRELSSVEGLHRQLTRRSNQIPVYSLSCETGVNAVLAALEKNVEIKSVVRSSTSPAFDLQRFFEERGQGAERMAVKFDWRPGDTEGDGVKVHAHASRLWSAQEAKRIFYSRENEAYERSAVFSAKHQLVTPASGAVVLENEQQYEDAGLEPVEKGTTTSIPDTGETMVMLLLGLSGLLASRRFLKVKRA